MTIGEKIKYFRTNLGITQAKLAELSEIHPVSIRKYETNKMQPQLPQIERIATALGVNINALISVNNGKTRLYSFGDLRSLLILWLNSGILTMTGEREEDLQLDMESIRISFNPTMADYLNIFTNTNAERLSFDKFFIDIMNFEIFNDIIRWEKCNYLLSKANEELAKNPNEQNEKIAQDLAETKEMIEMELMRSNKPLDIREFLKK